MKIYKKIWKHLRTIQIHRKWVRHYCFLVGIPWRGLVHDLSKYSPTEFFESARFWTGHTSPIDIAKKCQGYSLAWLHHRGRNPHHWAYWTDNYSENMITYCMPEKYFIEMVCDFLAAGHSYSTNNFTYLKEYEWWKKNRDSSCKAMNQKNKIMLDIIFSDLAAAEKNCQYHDSFMTPEQLLKSGYLHDIYEANK